MSCFFRMHFQRKSEWPECAECVCWFTTANIYYHASRRLMPPFIYSTVYLDVYKVSEHSSSGILPLLLSTCACTGDIRGITDVLKKGTSQPAVSLQNSMTWRAHRSRQSKIRHCEMQHCFGRGGSKTVTWRWTLSWTVTPLIISAPVLQEVFNQKQWKAHRTVSCKTLQNVWCTL